jgi:lysosomal alpha-mannosidase
VAAGTRAVAALMAGVGLANHHDALTGTSKQHVAEDYKRILDKALTAAEAVASNAAAAAGGLAELEFSVCRAANESQCAPSQGLAKQPLLSAGQGLAGGGGGLVVSVYNPLPRAVRGAQVEVLLSSDAPVLVTSLSTGVGVPSDLLPNVDVLRPNQPAGAAAAPFVLFFQSDEVPALGSALFSVQLLSEAEGGEKGAEERAKSKDARVSRVAKQQRIARAAAGDPSPMLTVSLDRVEVAFDKRTGLLASITRLDQQQPLSEGAPQSVSAMVTNEIGYYTSFGSPGIKRCVCVV